MTPTEQRAELLAALAEVEALREGADKAVELLRSVLAETAVTMPPLAEPERPQWVSALEAARILGVEKAAMTARCRRASKRGDSQLVRKPDGRWQVRLDLMAPIHGRPTR